VGINLFLLAALVLGTYSLPAAYAQRVGNAGNYVAVTCEVEDAYDVFYVVDLPTRRLHAFAPARTAAGGLQYIGSRDLESDFRRGQ
jgi:hypothetical protein